MNLERINSLIDKNIEIHKLASKVASSTEYRKKFDCKNCSEWFHTKKKWLDNKPKYRGFQSMKCELCGYYNLIYKSGKCKWNVDIYRKFTKFEITSLCIEKNWVIPYGFFEEEPDSEDSGVG